MFREKEKKMQTVEVLRDGHDRSVKLPGDLLPPSEDKVYINKIGNAIVLIPCHDSWKSLFDSLDEFSDDYMEDRAQPDQQVRESLF
jgi:antitoxin VapB